MQDLLPVAQLNARSLKNIFGDFGTSFLRSMPPEFAHSMGMLVLKSGLLNFMGSFSDSILDVSLNTEVPGVASLKQPLGIAAGFDKNAQALIGLKKLGFSFLELGTVTPLPQNGNPKPRLFRQKHQLALINRMGFNNHGIERVARRLRASQQKTDLGPVGVNLGKNKITSLEGAIEDYIQGILAFEQCCDYFVINISSPNTPNLRKLADPAFLKELAESISLRSPNTLKKVWIKLDPDMSKKIFQSTVECIASEKYAGIILTNTHKIDVPQKGGQSGHPLAIGSSQCLEWAYQVHQGQLPMIGCGGILSGFDIFHKMIRGACAVQIYTALIYRGPFVVELLLRELAAELKSRKIKYLTDIIGKYYEDPRLQKK